MVIPLLSTYAGFVKSGPRFAGRLTRHAPHWESGYHAQTCIGPSQEIDGLLHRPLQLPIAYCSQKASTSGPARPSRESAKTTLVFGAGKVDRALAYLRTSRGDDMAHPVDTSSFPAETLLGQIRDGTLVVGGPPYPRGRNCVAAHGLAQRPRPPGTSDQLERNRHDTRKPKVGTVVVVADRPVGATNGSSHAQTAQRLMRHRLLDKSADVVAGGRCDGPEDRNEPRNRMVRPVGRPHTPASRPVGALVGARLYSEQTCRAGQILPAKFTVEEVSRAKHHPTISAALNRTTRRQTLDADSGCTGAVHQSTPSRPQRRWVRAGIPRAPRDRFEITGTL